MATPLTYKIKPLPSQHQRTSSLKRPSYKLQRPKRIKAQTSKSIDFDFSFGNASGMGLGSGVEADRGSE